MSSMDKTVKTRKYSEFAESDISYNNLTETQERAIELVNKSAQLEAEKSKYQNQSEIIGQLQEKLEQQQVKIAEMVKKSAQYEASVKALAELELKTRRVEELESKLLKVADLEARAQKSDLLEAKVKELSDVIHKISGIAASGKTDL